jgi:hypothetical protein
MRNARLIGATVLSTAFTLGSINATAEDSDGWKFSVAPLYLWGKAIEAEASAAGQELPLSLDFQDDILENLDAAFAFHFEAQYGDFTLFYEYNFARLDPEVGGSAGPVEITGDVEFEDTMIEGGATWAFSESDSTRWEVLGGLRYAKQEVEVDITKNLDGPLPVPDEIKAGDSWAHPFVGVRVTTKMSDRWSFRGRVDIGGEDSNNQALSGLVFFDYRFRGWGSAFVGYRYLDMEFDNESSRSDQYGFDGDQQGPLIGLNFYF